MPDEDDIKELKEVFDVLGEKVPKLIEDIVKALYSTSNAEQFAKEVANFYKTMIEAGMPKEEAYELTKKFMESRDIVSVVKKILSDKGFKLGNIAKPPTPESEEETEKDEDE